MFSPPFQSGNITLKDGTILEGGTSVITNYRFKFKDAKTGKKRFIKNDDVVSVTKRFEDGGFANYETINCGGTPKLVRIVERGEISVFQYQVQRQRTSYVNNGGTNQFVPYSYIETVWFIMKKDEPCNLFQLKGLFSDKLNMEYKEFAQKIFADTPELIAKIGSEGYKYNDFIRNIREYNQIKNK